MPNSSLTPEEQPSERTLFMRWWETFRHTLGDEEAASHAAWRAWLKRSELIASETPDMKPMSMRAFGSSDALASYCINEAFDRQCTEWQVVYEMLKEVANGK